MRKIYREEKAYFEKTSERENKKSHPRSHAKSLAPRGASVIRQLKFPTRDKYYDSFPESIDDRQTTALKFRLSDYLALFFPCGNEESDLSTLFKGRILSAYSHKELAEKLHKDAGLER